MAARYPVITAGRRDFISSSFTWTVPDFIMPIAFAALTDKSIILPLTNGPRSLIRTMTSFPFRRLVTLTQVPKGSDGCAAVNFAMLNVSPFAVLRP